MSKTKGNLRGLIRRTRGANMVEYIMLVGLVALAGLVAFQTLGKNGSDKVNEQAGVLKTIPTPALGSN